MNKSTAFVLLAFIIFSLTARVQAQAEDQLRTLVIETGIPNQSITISHRGTKRLLTANYSGQVEVEITGQSGESISIHAEGLLEPENRELLPILPGGMQPIDLRKVFQKLPLAGPITHQTDTEKPRSKAPPEPKPAKLPHLTLVESAQSFRPEKLLLLAQAIDSEASCPEVSLKTKDLPQGALRFLAEAGPGDNVAQIFSRSIVERNLQCWSSTENSEFLANISQFLESTGSHLSWCKDEGAKLLAGYYLASKAPGEGVLLAEQAFGACSAEQGAIEWFFFLAMESRDRKAIETALGLAEGSLAAFLGSWASGVIVPGPVLAAEPPCASLPQWICEKELARIFLQAEPKQDHLLIAQIHLLKLMERHEFTVDCAANEECCGFALDLAKAQILTGFFNGALETLKRLEKALTSPTPVGQKVRILSADAHLLQGAPASRRHALRLYEEALKESSEESPERAIIFNNILVLRDELEGIRTVGSGRIAQLKQLAVSAQDSRLARQVDYSACVLQLKLAVADPRSSKYAVEAKQGIRSCGEAVFATSDPIDLSALGYYGFLVLGPKSEFGGSFQ